MRFLALAFFAGVSLSSPALAHPGGHDDGGYYRPATRTEPTVIPDTLPGVVASLRERTTAVSTALGAGKIADLHRACVNLIDLAAAVPAKAVALPDDAKAKAATASTHLQQKVAELYAAAGRADLAAGQSAIAAITADIDIVEGLSK